jgi:hypothetical protein
MDGRNHRVSTKEETLTLAKEFAKEWYMATYVHSKSQQKANRTAIFLNKFGQNEVPEFDQNVSHPKQSIQPKGHLFREATEKFISEYGIITEGQRSKSWTAQHEMRIKVHLMPFFGDKPLNEISAGLVQEYRIQRASNGHKGRKPSRSTLHHETVTLRLVLKTAHRYGWIQQVPDISAPYRTSGKVNHRAWFSPEEYKLFYEATRKRAKNPPLKRHRSVWEDLHDYVLFMANTGLRPDEAGRLSAAGLRSGREETYCQRAGSGDCPLHFRAIRQPCIGDKTGRAVGGARLPDQGMASRQRQAASRQENRQAGAVQNVAQSGLYRTDPA